LIHPARMSRHPISDLDSSAGEKQDVAGHLDVAAAHAAPDVVSCIQRTRGDLDGDRLIGQAVGILMERFEITADRALYCLRRMAVMGRLELRDVARALVARADARAKVAVLEGDEPALRRP
jgi:AmiR/NasT family two-component response regulator